MERSLCDDFEKMIGAKEYSDVLFLIGSDEEPVYAHKIILSYRVEYFEKMFNGEAKESNVEQVTFPHVDIKHFMKILRYIYTNTIYFDDIYVAIKIFVIANEWMFESLKDRCIYDISYKINAINMNTIMEYAIKYEQIHNMIISNATVIYDCLSNIEIERLPYEYFIKFVKGIHIKESDKFKMVYKYSKLTNDANMKNIKKNITDIISFDRISYGDLLYIVYPKNILPDSVMLRMLINNSKKKCLYIKYKPNHNRKKTLLCKKFKYKKYIFKLKIILNGNGTRK